ncbi:TIGR01440 family protein [Anaerococcus rubeinfantis]|uniref:TIGR01440 family protein n=1 Tax=Anaerococcus rubeinfantis TaxID=1720199 RepID=UPI00073E880F|nr:TIGR01440 family protein [Anaerococcus rubeinfantis]
MEDIKNEVKKACLEILEKSNAKEGEVFVLGGSSSEICGYKIGSHSSEEIGEVVVKTLLEILNEKKIFLAVGGCEHINRAIVIERELALRDRYEIVSVVPQIHAGGSFATAAYKNFKDPLVIEHISGDFGMDIGDANIGMHIKFVQVPLRLEIKNIGSAHLTALRSRPKLIGGIRARYE